MSNGNGRSTEGFGITRQQSVELIVRTCIENGVTHPRQVAYILATAQHETRDFTAPEEDFGRQQARRLGYRGGEEYFGRGYVHLTHKDNYERMDRLLGLNGALVRDPDLAKDPEVAARIMVVGMRDGAFTGRRLDRYIDADTNDLYNARRTVNGVTSSKPWSVRAAHECERYANAWEEWVPALVTAARGEGVVPQPSAHPRAQAATADDGQLTMGERGPEVVAMQQRLNALGYRDDDGHPLVEDGTFGPDTRDAVVAFQKANGLQGLGMVGPRTAAALQSASSSAEETETPSRAPGPLARGDSRVIYDEAHRHFLTGGNRFEYGRGDITLDNREGNRRTDSSRTEQDIDRDGLKGVDCSSFVWRALRNAGYDVPATPFSTHALFNGHQPTRYAREHFDVIPASDARRDRGDLQPGDVLLFKDRNSSGQHIGIVKDYDTNGRIQFIGSQVSLGPAQASAGQGSYWNGGEFEIVGALRAKPEFQVRPPLHADSKIRSVSERPAGLATAPDRTPDTPLASTAPSADADGQLRFGERGAAVATLQQRLADLGYRGADGKPLRIDGDFGTHTREALKDFQQANGLQGLGVGGPKTELALDRAERALMTHPSHPHHALYSQVLEKVHAEERTRGIQPGHHSQRIAAALAVECLREGITRVDRVELNRDTTLVRGVEVSPVRDEPGLNRSTDAISTAQATQQPLRESSEQIHQVAVNHLAQQREEQRQARPAPALP